ncbi:uncharacterized protein [Apostichopus japonicus]|uniref:uncharacterized protein n=1 Tax=Stichopus japonicus TaxID=307972 RepID=UPI003AB4B519
MAADITAKVENCETCQAFVNKHQKETMLSHPIPSRPWEIVSQDLMSHKGKEYLVTVDHYSDMWLMDEMQSTSAHEIVTATKKHFALHGICDIFNSDNGPQYVSEEFVIFAKEYEFEHNTSSPYRPKGNGKAESAVKIATKLLKKTLKEGSDFHLAVLDWRNTPDTNGNSPGQKLLQRRTRNLMPNTEAQLEPHVVQDVSENILHRKRQSKKEYDAHAKDLPQLVIGRPVKVQTNSKTNPWVDATCKAKVGPRSYLVETPDHRVYRRNRAALRAAITNKRTKQISKRNRTSIAKRNSERA